jgi:hypothetical protein
MVMHNFTRRHPSNMYSEGNATILVKARKADGTYLSGNITRFIGYVSCCKNK